MKIKVCLAGATGWVGRALVPAILAADDLELVGAVARRAAGCDVGEALGRDPTGVVIAARVATALETPADVLVDYTSPESVKANVFEAIERGVNVVIGTAGLTDHDFAQIAALTKQHKVGVIAAGNFSVTAALWQHFALLAATRLPDCEILDYGAATMPHVPSATTRELAERLASIDRPAGRSGDATRHGPREARGADILGTRVHSIRSPGFVLSAETIFGLPNERLTIRHDAYGDAQPYVAGTLLAVRRINGVSGLIRGLDTLLFCSTDADGLAR